MNLFSQRLGFTSRNAAARSMVVTLATTLLVLFLSGCGGGGGGGGNPPPPAPPAPPPASTNSLEVKFGASSIAFGKVVLNKTIRSALVLQNTGDTSLNVGISSPGAGFAVEGSCGTMRRNAECTVFLLFTPTEQRTYSSSLNITSAAPTKNVALTGEGQGIELEITQLSDSCQNTITGRLSVSDSDSNPITGLVQSDFRAVLSGADSSFSAFSTIATRTPVAVGLVLDNSGSLVDNQVEVQDAARIFIDTLTDADRAGIFKFSAEIDRNFQDFITADTAGKEALRVALNRDFDGGATGRSGSNIWGATNTVVEKLKLETTPLRVAILISDGENTVTTTALTSLITSATNSNVQVFVVGYGDIQLEGLEQLATGTGGSLFVSPNTSNLTGTFDAITGLLGNQYSFSLPNPSMGPSRSLRIIATSGSNVGEDTKEVVACP